MVFAVKPVMLLVKLPVPAPSEVMLSVMVGVALVLQQTPRAVTVAPPSEVTLPPPIAVVCVIPFTAVVVNTAETVTGTSTSAFLQLLVSIRTNPIVIKGKIQILVSFFIISSTLIWQLSLLYVQHFLSLDKRLGADRVEIDSACDII